MGRPWCCGRGCGVSRRERREERRAALAAAAARTAATRSLPDDTWQVEGCLSENLRYSCQLYEYSSTLGAVRVTLTLTLALSHCTQPIQSPWDVNPSSEKTSPNQSSHQDERKTRKDPHGSTSDRCGPCTHRSRYGTLQPASHLERSCGLRCHEQTLLQHKARTCQKVIPHRHCAPDLGCFSSCAVLA